MGHKVFSHANISLDERTKENKVSLLLHKPLGYVSIKTDKNYKQAIDLIKESNQFKKKNMKNKFSKKILTKLAPAGRLDIDSTGLMIFTQDGTIAKKIIKPDSKIEKEYIVKFSGDINSKKIDLLTYGISIDGIKLKKAAVFKISNNQLKIILVEGKKRQIRKMLRIVNLDVLSLKRVRIGKVNLGNLPYGKWRFLKNSEEI